MAIEYPDLPEVEVLLNGRPLPRAQWERHAVHRVDLLDAMSGTRAVTYGCNGTVTIQKRAAPPQQSPAATPERKEGGNHG